LKFVIVTSFALIALSTKNKFTVDRSLSTHATWNCDSKGLFTTVNQYGCSVYEVTTFIYMILNV